MKLVGIGNVHWLLILVVVTASMAVAQKKKLDGKIDLVAIVTWPYVEHRDDGIDRSIVAKAYFDFFDAEFAISSSQTRLGAVQISGSNNSGPILTSEKIVQTLTDDVKLFKDKMSNWYAIPHHHDQSNDTWWYYWYLNFAFKAINEHIFLRDDAERAKVVIIGAGRGTHELEDAVLQAKRLCDRGVHIYVAVRRSNGNANLQMATDHAKTYLKACFQEDNLIVIPKDDNKKDIEDGLLKLKEKMTRDLCGWNAMCRYSNGSSGKCVPDVWQSGKCFINAGQCSKAKPTLSSCKPDDCRKTCDDLWPWQTTLPNCNKSCGQTVQRVADSKIRVRNQSKKDKLKKHCPHEFTCAPCPTRALAGSVTEESNEPSTQLWIIVGVVVGVVLLITVASVVFLIVVLKKRKAERKVEDAKIEALTKTIAQMTVQINASRMGGADAGMGADLSDKETMKKPVPLQAKKTIGSMGPSKQSPKKALSVKMAQESGKKTIVKSPTPIKSMAKSTEKKGRKKK